MENEINKCLNCEFYLKHYVKTKCGFLQTVYGHCAYSKSMCKTSKTVPCMHWREKTDAEPENIILKNELNKILKELKHIVQSLKG